MPEAEQACELEFEQDTEPDVPDVRLRFRVPEFLIYCGVRIQFVEAGLNRGL